MFYNSWTNKPVWISGTFLAIFIIMVVATWTIWVEFEEEIDSEGYFTLGIWMLAWETFHTQLVSHEASQMLLDFHKL